MHSQVLWIKCICHTLALLTLSHFYTALLFKYTWQYNKVRDLQPKIYTISCIIIYLVACLHACHVKFRHFQNIYCTCFVEALAQLIHFAIIYLGQINLTDEFFFRGYCCSHKPFQRIYAPTLNMFCISANIFNDLFYYVYTNKEVLLCRACMCAEMSIK